MVVPMHHETMFGTCPLSVLYVPVFRFPGCVGRAVEG